MIEIGQVEHLEIDPVRREDPVRLRPTRSSTTDRKWDTARNVIVHDFSHAGGYLVAGAMALAILLFFLQQAGLE